MNATLIISLLAVLLTAPPDGGSKLVKDFQDPPRAARPYVWWHWMDGEVSLDGIRKDLEWMDAVGIAGFHQFDAGGVNMPKAAPFKRPYLSEDWKEAFRYAVCLADSLGMEMAVASAPGWSSTGGPWVSPDDAMKKLEWQTVEVDGGSVDIQLPALQKVTGPYRDIPRGQEHVIVEPYGYDVAVIAVRLSEADRTMAELGANTSVSDSVITVAFPRKTTVRALTLRTGATGNRFRTEEAQCPHEFQCSNDGRNWKTVSKLMVPILEYATVNVPPTKARYFRVKGPAMKSLELFTVPRVERVEERNGSSYPFDAWKYTTDAVPAAFCVREEDVVDISAGMGEDGHLVCTLPKGRWRIWRFGASLTGKMNHPASPNATGLEVDKLNPGAWERYFHRYLEMYKEAAGGMLGSKGITHLLIDSYEAGPETWTPALPEEFKVRRGYDLMPWLPVLTGQIIGSAEKSEQFLRDWRNTLSELFEENYCRVNDIIATFGMKGTYIESHELNRAFQGDGMAVKKNATVPMSGIWMTNSLSGSLPAVAISDIRESASVAHIYGKPIVAAESFTVNGDGKRAYTYHPGNIKMVADIALASGLNRFVIHDSASQPSDDYLPGLALFRYGQWFHRNETWAPYARVWTDYLARSCQMMQTGRSVADILLFYGEDTNATGQYGGESLSYLPHIPAGYNFDYANPDVLLHEVKPEGGCLVTGSGQRYKVLVLGGLCRKFMSDGIRARIDALRAAGVPVCFEDELPAILKAADIAPDVVLEGPADGIWNDGFLFGGNVPKNSRGYDCTIAGIQFVHRTGGGTDIYWLGNFTQKEWNGKVRFREGGPCAALFNAEDGSMFRIPRNGDGVELALKAGDAIFVVLTDYPLDIPEARPEYKASEVMTPERWWDVEFHQKGGESALETFSELNDWTTNMGDPVIRYFSGTAHYSSAFTIPAGALDGLEEARIDLGVVHVMAELIVNGHNAGVLWREPFLSPDLLQWLHEGENTIEVNVTNLWVNRMIGDRQKGEIPVTKVRRFYNAGDKLLPSGLLGPVRLMGYK